MSITDHREYECTNELCKCWFGIHDNWDENSVRCPLCGEEVKQL